MNYYLQDQNKSPVKSRSTSLTLREHIQKWTDRLNTLFILKHLRDLCNVFICWCTERHHWSPTADPRLHHVMWQRLRGNVFLSITTTVNLHYWNDIYDKQFPLWIIKKYKTPQQHKDLKKCLLTMAYIISLIHQSLVRWRNNSSFFKLFLTHSDSI